MIIAGILAGILSTVTGLASLVSFPALTVIAGFPAVIANATNTTALIFTGISSAFSSREELKGHWKELGKILCITFVGGIFGCLLLILAPAKAFQTVVPLFILVAGVMILFPHKVAHSQAAQNLRSNEGSSWNRIWKPILTVIGIFLLGAYAGYFGAAAGVIMLAVLAHTSTEPFPVYNAIRNVALCSANVVAGVMYTYEGYVRWDIVIPLGIGFVIGGYFGPKIVRHIPARLIEVVTGILALILAWHYFVQYYGLAGHVPSFLNF
ncbi:UPF0721 transmembrane protein [Philodulcilactobacillus myokoensis]|uniref:Probable membrane transporter protein n=2 Tax=Philodulcilactobacillus myokoensis TaxID=2929573 RepID=A0A9W6B0C0_9LACO|nr:UPF0721 transmembrane protein [Philodulcilactobacillus myokoensis]